MKKRLAYQVAIPVLAVAIITILGFVFVSTFVVNQIIDKQINEQVVKARESYKGNYERFINKAVQISAIISSQKGVIEAFKTYNSTNDLEKSVNILKEDFQNADKAMKYVGYKNLRIHFHTKDYKSFYRSWVDKRGDDLSFRNTLKKCINEKTPILGIEAGRGGIAIRGIMPVLDENNEVLGSVENHIDVGELMKILSTDTLSENYALYIMPELVELMDKNISNQTGNRSQLIGAFMLLSASSNYFITDNIDETILKQAINEAINIRGESHYYNFNPAFDFDGKPIGVIAYQYNLDEINRKSKSLKITFILIGVFAGVILIMLIFVSISRNLNKPINKIKEYVKGISEGDLSSQLEFESDNELGEVRNDLEKMKINLKEIVSTIINESEKISKISNEMSNSAIDISRGASDQASSIEEMSSSMEEISSNIQQNFDNTRQTEQIAIQSAQSAKEGNRSAEEMADSMHSIAEKVKIINDLAFQTNILALNAAVEAARAGEQGKGFAVVASEVRKLAERSKLASDEIANIINVGVQSSKNISEKLLQIVPQIEKTAQLIQEVSVSSHEVSEGSMEINNAMSQLNQITQQTASQADAMSNVASELKRQANYLKEQVEYFKVD